MDLMNLGRHFDQHNVGHHHDTQLPPGFRFHPSDEELITYYLLKKVMDSNFTCRAIAEVDLNKCEPWQLPGNNLHLTVCTSISTSHHFFNLCFAN